MSDTLLFILLAIITTLVVVGMIVLMAAVRVSGDLSEEERKELHDENA